MNMNNGFYSLLFHGVYNLDEKHQFKNKNIFISSEELENCIKILIDNDFTFIDPDDVLISPYGSRNVLLTVDDGYHTNFHILKVLERYNIPALFFFVKYQVAHQKMFWWDVYLINKIHSTPFSIIYNDIQKLKLLARKEIESRFVKEFGNTCFDSDGQLVRPMTCKELKRFSEHPLVRIGAHTVSHEILTNCYKASIKKEIGNCKQFLEKITKKNIYAFSYPNGDYNSDIVSVTFEMGFKYAVTIRRGFNYYHQLVKYEDWLTLRRNTFPIPNLEKSVVQ